MLGIGHNAPKWHISIGNLYRCIHTRIRPYKWRLYEVVRQEVHSPEAGALASRGVGHYGLDVDGLRSLRCIRSTNDGETQRACGRAGQRGRARRVTHPADRDHIVTVILTFLFENRYFNDRTSYGLAV